MSHVDITAKPGDEDRDDNDDHNVDEDDDNDDKDKPDQSPNDVNLALSSCRGSTIAAGRYQESKWSESAAAELPHLLSVHRARSLKA